MAFSVLFALSSRSLDGMRRARDIERRVEFARTKVAELRLVDQLRVGDRANGALDDGTKWSVEVLPFVQPVPDGPRPNLDSVVRVHFVLEWQGRNEPQRWAIDSYRFVRYSPAAAVPLEEKLRVITRR